MSAPQPFTSWAATYELFEGEVARSTWQQGILPELRDLDMPGPRVLDVGGGTGIGRRALAGALPAARVTVLDRSPEMLVAGGVPEADRVVADMADFVLEARFDAVVSGFDALNYLDYRGLCGFFRSAARVLTDHGVLVFDYSSPKVLREDWRHLDSSTERDGLTLRRFHRFDDLLQRSETRLELWRGGALVWSETHHQYSYDTYDLYRLADRDGLVIEMVRDIDGDRFTPSCTTHVYRLRRHPGGAA